MSAARFSERKRKRPTISDGMKYRALKLHGAVLVRCFGCVRHRNRMEAQGLRFDGDGSPFPDTTWHPIDAIQFDHVHELADGGGHSAKKLGPLCIPCHKEKTARNEKLRHHLDRAAKKHRGEFKSKRPMAKSNHPIAKRVDPWGKNYRAKLEAKS